MRFEPRGSTNQPLRILFSVRNPSYVRHYESVLRALAERGHEVELATRRGNILAGLGARARVRCPGIRLSTTPDVSGDPWWELATRFRQARFYLRFLEPAVPRHARRCWPARAAGRPGLRSAWRRRCGSAARGRRTAGSGRSTCSSSHPHGRVVPRRIFASRRPDLVVMTPLVVLKTAQLDLARAAIELGHPQRLCRRELGSPVQQRRADVLAAAGDRLERGPEA